MTFSSFRTAADRGSGSWPALTCMRPSSAQRQSWGKTLPGLSRLFSSKAHLSRCCWLRSLSLNMVVHQVALLDADPVLAGQNAADLDAEPQDVVAELLRALQFA